MVETISMAKYFDYFDIENDHLFLMDGSVSKIFKIECLDPSSMTKEELLALNDKIAGLCQMVEKGIDLQIFFRSKNRYEKGLKLYDQYLETMRMDSRFASRLSLSKIDSLRSSNLFCSDIYVIINVHRFFDKKKSVETFDINKKHLDKICNNINAYLQDISRGVKSLEENEIANFLYECLNPGRWENIQEFNYKGKNSMIFDETLRSKLNFHGYLFNKDHFYAEGRYGQCINLLNLPEETYPAMFFDLLSGFEKAFEFNFSYRISAVNQTAVVSFQDGMRNVYKSLLNTSLLGSDNTNYAVEKKMTENEQFLSAVSDGQQRIYEVGLCLTHYADTYENLTYQSDMILRSFRLLNGCDGFVEEYNQQKTFISSLPASRAHLEKPFKFLTDNVADFSPLYEPYKGTEKPTLLLRNRFNGIIKFDPFSAKDVQNYNAIVCGKSGSGKSFLISHICQTFIAQGYPVIFVDIGGSFKRTVECFSGQYFDLNENVSINPLFPKSQVEKNGVISTVAIQSMVEILVSMMKDVERAGISNEEKLILGTVLEKMYGAVESPILTNLLECMDILYKQKVKNPDQIREAKVILKLFDKLKFWAFGTYQNLFNKETSIHMDSKLIGFDLNGIPKDVRPHIFLIINAWISQLVFNEPGKKLVVFDEAWEMIHDGSSIMEGLYRKGRKHDLSVISATQSYNDFLSCPIASAILANSDTKYILQVKESIDKIQQSMDLNDIDMNAIHCLTQVKGEYSEVFIKFGSQKFVSRIVPSSLEYWMSTTHPDDLQAQMDFQKIHPKYEKIRVLTELAHLYPHGTALRKKETNENAKMA